MTVGDVCDGLLKGKVFDHGNIASLEYSGVSLKDSAGVDLYAPGMKLDRGISISGMRVNSFKNLSENVYRADLQFDLESSGRGKTHSVPFNFKTLDGGTSTTKFEKCLTPDRSLNITGDDTKAPSESYVIAESQIVKWQCKVVDIGDLCGDQDGCRVEVMMSHKTQANDQVRIHGAHLYMEQRGNGLPGPLNDDFSLNRQSGTYGWTTRESGSTNAWILNWPGKLYSLYNPWDWMYIQNFVHKSCPPSAAGGGGTNGPAFSGADRYKVNIRVHPKVKLKIMIYD
jgi:hypothetical protein